MEKYAVYTHSFNGVVFYVGSGIYDRDNISKSRAFDFRNRSKNWKEFSEGNTDQVKVRVFLRTNNRQAALDFEEELTQRYFDHKAPLVNVDIGTRHSEEWKKQHSIAMSGENNPMYGKTAANAKKVFVIDNESGETKIFDSIAKAYQFLSQKGFDKTKMTLQNYLNKGIFNFKNYTMELALK